MTVTSLFLLLAFVVLCIGQFSIILYSIQTARIWYETDRSKTALVLSLIFLVILFIDIVVSVLVVTPIITKLVGIVL